MTDQFQLRQWTLDDVDATLDLLQSVKWTRTRANVEQAIRWMGSGAFCVAAPEQLLAIGGATIYGPELAWIGMMVTRAEYQRRGLGGQIMNAILGHLRVNGVRCAMLDALDTGITLYKRCGFHEYGTIEMWVNDAVIPDIHSQARRLQPGDIPAVIRLDGEFFGVERPQIILACLEEHPDCAWVDEENGIITGFLLSKPRPPDGIAKIGPWIHHTPAGAEKLLRTMFQTPGAPTVRLYIPEANHKAKEIAARNGFDCRLRLTRMIYGAETLPFPSMDAQYSIAMSMTG